ncbi:uncharacterized protein K452DRAFT_19334 [Aplosporella prunicola CBS 121167]|uniref:Uncharacterized protein n=1 Tax=Aplosporella prunicola CBS 121167 TaxID=1176127 RepID=A0A6A6BGM3_9PEZI|nr:uncharacterized protein K452DRAFT_19334 [Aplosporella prunicola CBS 121167]KAF2142465.1 hypothetical protein K452DRAFT_19334 [Aplosporella prunicola CBS 121167]
MPAHLACLISSPVRSVNAPLRSALIWPRSLHPFARASLAAKVAPPQQPHRPPLRRPTQPVQSSTKPRGAKLGRRNLRLEAARGPPRRRRRGEKVARLLAGVGARSEPQSKSAVDGQSKNDKGKWTNP